MIMTEKKDSVPAIDLGKWFVGHDVAMAGIRGKINSISGGDDLGELVTYVPSKKEDKPVTEKKMHQWIVSGSWVTGYPHTLEALTKAQAITTAILKAYPHADRKAVSVMRKVTTCVKVKTPRPKKVPLLKEPCPLCKEEGIEKWAYPAHWEVCHRTDIRAPMSQAAHGFHK